MYITYEAPVGSFEHLLGLDAFLCPTSHHQVRILRQFFWNGVRVTRHLPKLSPPPFVIVLDVPRIRTVRLYGCRILRSSLLSCSSLTFITPLACCMPPMDYVIYIILARLSTINTIQPYSILIRDSAMGAHIHPRDCLYSFCKLANQSCWLGSLFLIFVMYLLVVFFFRLKVRDHLKCAKEAIDEKKRTTA